MKKSLFVPARRGGLVWISPGQLEAFSAAGTNAHRLATFSEGWVERFGDDLLLSYKSESALGTLRTELAGWAEPLGFRWRRLFGKFLPRQNAERIAPTLLEGDAALSAAVEVLENGVRYGLDFAAGYSAGLFLDQRHNRALVRRRNPKRVLNTFAYTCSFSVVAAMAGARTTSVDLSAKSLDRGRENFALNGLSTEGHSFLADDVLEVLPRLARRGENFDTIILDPPTFSRNAKGKRFQVEHDLETLLIRALEVCTPQGAILLSTNCTRLTTRDLENLARLCLKLERKAATLHHEPSLPDIPMDAAAQTVWLLLK